MIVGYREGRAIENFTTAIYSLSNPATTRGIPSVA